MKYTLYTNQYMRIAAMSFVLFFVLAIACQKKNSGIPEGGAYNTSNSLTLFRLDSSTKDLLATDTIYSQSSIAGKFIPVNGASGASNGLGEIKIELRLITNDSLLNTKLVTRFARPDYTILNNESIDIPKSMRGRFYRIVVIAKDKSGTEIGRKTFIGQDILTCDPLPSCIVSNQVTFLVETPANTPPADNIYIFGGFNGWSNTDQTYRLNKNPDVPNCYCISMPFQPGAAAWQIGEIYVTRGSYGTNAVTANGAATFVADYNSGDLGTLFKIKVPKWRDR
jgi:hypothetical protein